MFDGHQSCVHNYWRCRIKQNIILRIPTTKYNLLFRYYVQLTIRKVYDSIWVTIKLIIILSSSTYCFWVILHFCYKCFLHIFYGTRDQNTLLYAMLYWRRCVSSCKYLIHLRKIKAFQRNGNNNTIIMYVYYLTLPHGKWD